jgi:DNA-binding NtrC family response regulator
VEQHRGFATVDSVAGKGTVFTIFFPLSDSPVSIQRPATKPRCGGETILFVEDEFSVRKLCSMMLRQTGFRVIEAGNAREALTHWKELGNTIDLVVTDMVMPGGLSGSDLITKLRESRPEVKVILTTGYNEEILKADDLTEARVKLITKPYDIESLLRAIAEKLQEKLSPAGRS